MQGWFSLDSFVYFGEPHATLWVPVSKDGGKQIAGKFCNYRMFSCLHSPAAPAAGQGMFCVRDPQPEGALRGAARPDLDWCEVSGLLGGSCIPDYGWCSVRIFINWSCGVSLLF